MGFLLDEYKRNIEPLNREYAQMTRQNYTDISGITHIYVKDTNEEIVIGRCINCGIETTYSKNWCAKCDRENDLWEREP